MTSSIGVGNSGLQPGFAQTLDAQVPQAESSESPSVGNSDGDLAAPGKLPENVGDAVGPTGNAGPADAPVPEREAEGNELLPTSAEAPGPSHRRYAGLETGADWPTYGGTHHALRYSPLTQITKENASQLEKIWKFRTGDLPRADEPFGSQNTPVKVGDCLYICSALNTETGQLCPHFQQGWRR